jgi:type VI secretion system VgrG family protein
MASKPKQHFTFQSDALKTDTFTVVRFDGTEALSSLFRFDITLLADSPDIDLAKLLRHAATLTIKGKEAGDLRYHGILSRCTLDRAVGKRFLYQARLVPLCWRLTLIEHNQVFLNRTIPQIVDAVLRDGDLSPADFDFRLQSDYEPREYVCQYKESHYHFMARRMEQSGIYTFFEHRSGRDCLVITDTLVSHAQPKNGSQLVYVPDSGLDGISKTKSVQQFTKVHTLVPGAVRLRDYNYRKPSQEMSGEAKISENGFGHVYHYGDHFQSHEQGQRLAAIRAEEQRWQEQLFQGESTAVGIQPGFLFSLNSHFREDLNRHYLCVEIEHHGSQGEDILDLQQSKPGEGWYRNTFTAIPSDVQFRPKRQTPASSFSGTINARIDGHGSGDYAELDEQGRYKVVLPFDISGRIGGKASAWLRMMQPFTGQGYGMHFPLRKGTEVLLTFIDGNPDRPIISGAVPNTETRSVVNAENPDRAGFQTAGGSCFYTDDRPTHEHMMFKAGDNSSGLRIGAGSDSSVAAWSSNLFMGGTAMSVIGSLMANYTFAAIQDTSITGWKFGLIMKVLEKFMLRAPKIIDKYDRAYTDAAPDVIRKEVDLVSSISSIVEILVELYFIALTIKEMGAEGKAGESAYLVYSKDGETLVRNKAAGKHIYFNTETGDIYGEGINIELESGLQEENHLRLGSGKSDEKTDTRATVELVQGNITITSGNLGSKPAKEEESEDGDKTEEETDTEKTGDTKEESKESGAVEPSGNAPPSDDGKNFIKLVSGLKGDDSNAQAMLELMQGDMVMRSGNGAGEDGGPRSIWLISGGKGEMATAQLYQGSIEMLSGEGADNCIRLISGGSGGGDSAQEDTETDDEKEKESDTEDESDDDSSESSDGGLAIVELKQGTVTIKSGDAQIIISNGEIKLSGQITLEGAKEGKLKVDSESKIILG